MTPEGGRQLQPRTLLWERQPEGVHQLGVLGHTEEKVEVTVRGTSKEELACSLIPQSRGPPGQGVTAVSGPPALEPRIWLLGQTLSQLCALAEWLTSEPPRPYL